MKTALRQGPSNTNPERHESGAPLRILVVANVPCDINSGAAGTVYQTSCALRALGHEVDEIWETDLPARRISHGNLHSLLEQPRSYRRGVLQAHAKKTYDVVQISQPQAYLAAAALRRSGFRGVMVNRSHGVELRVDEVLKPWYRKLGVAPSRFPLATRYMQRLLAPQWKAVVRESDGIVVGSQLDKLYLESRIPGGKGKVITVPEGVEPKFLSHPRSEHARSDAPRILHVGQFAFVKGSALIPSIVGRVLEEDRRASFTWVCAARHHEEIAGRFSPNVRDRVNLLDWMPVGELCDVYDSHEIFLFPSLFEGFGKAPFEAMARGMCVVSSDEGGMRDHIRSGHSGFLVEPGDVDGFCRRLLQLMESPDLREKISRAALEVVREMSWSRCARTLVDFYRVLLARRSR